MNLMKPLRTILKDILILYNCPPAEKNRAEPEEQKGKKEGGWGEGIFALLRLRLERFRFSLIKRKPKQKFFHLQLKEKNGGQKKIKNVMKKFLFWFVVAKRRQAETHQQNYQFSRSVRFRSEPPRARRVVSRGSVQKRLEFQPKGTYKINHPVYPHWVHYFIAETQGFGHELLSFFAPSIRKKQSTPDPASAGRKVFKTFLCLRLSNPPRHFLSTKIKIAII